MDILIKVLLMLHFLGLAMGMGSGMAMSRMGPKLAAAQGDTRTVLFDYGKLLGMNGHIGLGLLWVTGIVMVLLKYQDIASLSVWFWVKMAFVVALSAAVGMGAAAYRRARAGDTSAMARAKTMGMISGLSGLGAVISAVMAFN